MVRQVTRKKFKKVLAGVLSALMVISCTNPIYVSADVTDAKNRSGGAAADNGKLQEITLELDMTDGLMTGETYLDDMVSVSNNMAYTEEEVVISNLGTVSGYVQGDAVLSEEDGAAIRFVPKEDGVIQVAGQLEEGSHFQISQVVEVSAVSGSSVNVVFDYENREKEADILFEEFEVKADETYYIGAKDSNMRFYLFHYTYKGYVDTEIKPIIESREAGIVEMDLVDALKQESGVVNSKDNIAVGSYVNGMIAIGAKMEWQPKTIEEHFDVKTQQIVSEKTYHQIKNGKDKKGALQFTPKYDGKIQIIAQIDAQVKAGESPKSRVMQVYVSEGGAEDRVIYEYTHTGDRKSFIFEEIEVKKDQTYYMLQYDKKEDGTESPSTAYIYKINYSYKEEDAVETEKVTDDLVDLLKQESGVVNSKDNIAVGSYVNGTIAIGAKMEWQPKTIEEHFDVKTQQTVSEKTYHQIKNGKDKKGALQFTPKYDGKIQIIAQIDAQVKAGESPKSRVMQVYVSEGGAEDRVIYEYTHTGDRKNFIFEEIEVKKDQTYYMLQHDKKEDGTESPVTAYIYKINYTYEKEITETPELIIPAFPGAEGGGKYVSGGRGKPVYTVTNLKDDAKNPPEGSLRWALEQTKTPTDPEDKNSVGGTIVFNVSGNIELDGTLRFDNIKNVTIAGQTAPGDGITLSGYDTNISGIQNVIIRYMRFRPGAINVHSGGDSLDALWGRDNKGFMVDHCSFSWNTDECLSLYRGEDGTVQWSLVYESLTLSGHSKGRHGYGAIAGGDNVTFHHNLYADHTSRNPRFGGGYAAAADNSHVAVVQFSNNVIYNWGFNTAYGGGQTFTNFVENYEIAGPGTRDSVKDWVINPGETGKLGGFYINNNYINGRKVGLLDTIEKINENGKFAGNPDGDTVTTISSVPYTSKDSVGPNEGKVNEGFDEYIENGIEDGSAILDKILAQAGATYPRRDAIDARLTAEVENRIGRYVNTEHEVGGYLSAPNEVVESHPADWDTDGDGIPDKWETENGLNPNDPSDGRAVSKDSKEAMGYDGYTNLEVYLSSIVEIDHAAENPKAEITAPENNAMIQKGTDVTITVNAAANVGSIERAEFYYGTLTDRTYIGEGKISGSTISCKLPELPDGSYFITARVYDTEGNATQTTAHEIHINTSDAELLAEGWTSQSIGNVDVPGYANLENGVLTVKGNGKLGKEEGSINGTESAKATEDSFHYAYKEITGDIEITAKVESISSVDNHAFAGIMVREDLEADSAAVALGLSWTKTDETIGVPWSVYMAGRDAKGKDFSNLADPLDWFDNVEGAAERGIILRPSVKFKDGAKELGYWIRLVRKGNDFTAYCSVDGTMWELMGTKTVEMNKKVYVGFAADSNRAANEIKQVNTARFSNIQMGAQIFDINYQLENIEIPNRPETVLSGNTITISLTAPIGYCVPKTVQVKIGKAAPVAIAVESTDPLEGILTIPNVTGSVTITAKAEIDKTGVAQVEPEAIDTGGFLTVTEKDGALILDQTATTGNMTKTAGSDLAKNVSYYVFPATTDGETMEMDITILGRTDDKSKDKGLFVGVFGTDGREEFSSLGFRHVSGDPKEMGGLTGYWTKGDDKSGNGGSKCDNGLPNNDPHTKPNYELNKTYHVIFEKTKDGYRVNFTGTYAGKDSGVYPNGTTEREDMKLYKVFSDKKPSETAEVRYGFALIGVTAKIENLQLKDSKGRSLYLLGDAPESIAEEPEDITLELSTGGVTKETILEKLPKTVNMQYVSGAFKKLPVTWDTTVLADVYKNKTTITLNGVVEGTEFKPTVKVILTTKTVDDDDDDDDDDSSSSSGRPSGSSSSSSSTPAVLTSAEQRLAQSGLGSGVSSAVQTNEGKLVIGTNKEIVFCEKNGTLSKNKWQKVGGDWYYFKNDGKAADGWIKPNGKWYYLDSKDKVMQKGWLKTPDNKWYLLDDVNGDMKTGWQKKNNKWYLLDDINGDMKTGWQLKNGKWYLLDDVNGDMKTGWQLKNGKWYLLDDVNGDMKIGWQMKNGKWYYLTASGAMAANTTTPDGYKVGASGEWIP